MLQQLTIGDEVAILPENAFAPSEAMEICEIGFVGIGYIQLMDGRMYSSTDGRCLGTAHGGHAVFAHDGHRLAVARRMRQSNQQKST